MFCLYVKFHLAPYLFFSFIWGTYHVLRQGWIRELFLLGDSSAMTGGYPQSAESLGCRTFYIFELGFWLSCCLYLGFETRRKDFVEMFIHHCSTVALILISHLSDYGRAGILVMMIHDVGDIFLYSAKSSQYKKFNGLADMLFAVFALVFYISRWFILPVYVIYPLIKTLTGGQSNKNLQILESYGTKETLQFLTGLLCTLLALHLMWGFTIARMIKATLVSKKQVSGDGDPRSEDESRISPSNKGNEMRKRK